MVKHEPLVNIFLVPSGELPVKIFGVKVSGLGLSWLQAVVAGQAVTFIPVATGKDFVQCQVLLMQEMKNVSISVIPFSVSRISISRNQYISNN